MADADRVMVLANTVNTTAKPRPGTQSNTSEALADAGDRTCVDGELAKPPQMGRRYGATVVR